MRSFRTILRFPVPFALLLIFPVSFFILLSPLPAQSDFTGPKTVQVEKGLASLPSDSGQFWMTYDITPYTSLFPNLPSPEQAIVNWILYDTGNDFWHKVPFGVFSATSERLYVYHNEKVQQYVSNILDRFLDAKHKNDLFQVRIIVLESPDWRTKAASKIHPYPVNKKELSGWVINKSDAPALLQLLSKRPDYLELNASRNVVPNAETFGWVLPAPSRTYVRDIQVAPSTPQGYVTDEHSIDEGYRMEVTPLVSTNGEQVEILFRCQSTVIEKMDSVSLKIPTATAPRQQLSAEVPQIARTDIEDKISIPMNLVFLLDLGMIPMVPEAVEGNSGLVNILPKSIYRNVLVLIQKNELAPQTETPSESPAPSTTTPAPSADPAPASETAPTT